jgi:cell division protein FtsN
MVEREAESGRELVLDNRKLLGIFLVFMVIIGIAFVLGFRLGKRQGIQQGEQSAADTAYRANPSGAQAPSSKLPAADRSSTPPKEDSGEPQLNWLQNVSRKERTTEVAYQTTAGGTAVDAKNSGLMAKPAEVLMKEQKGVPAQEPSKKSITGITAASKPQRQADVPQSSPIIYSVQVGAFRVKSEAERKAKALRAQQYDCRIEEPQSPESLYLLKVGSYKSRAEAIVMKNRLNKSGFSTLLKTN